ncbi:MAG: class B sortase [Lachnospiraceae bacterium]|nr:class B sortase [Lachnospiraceae bacterium]
MNSPKKRKEKVLKFLLMFFSLTSIILLGCLAVWYVQYKNQVRQNEQLAKIHEDSRQGILSFPEGETVVVIEPEDNRSEKLSEENPDYVGWITAEGTRIDCPVVSRDNSFYLTHDFYGEKNRHGAIFLDASCAAGDQNLLLHGHNMKDGTMFAGLKEYKKKDFRKSNGTIFFEIANEYRKYTVFAAARIDLTQEDFFHYEKLPQNQEDMNAYLKGIKENAVWYDADAMNKFDWKTTYMLVLSTCEYGTADERFIVVAECKRKQEETQREEQ